MKLLKTIYSTLNTDYVFGNAGDEVIIICRNNDLLMVENIKTQDQFSVERKFIGNDNDDLLTTQIQSVPDTTEIINKVSVSDTTIKTVRLSKKAKPNKQQSLF